MTEEDKTAEISKILAAWDPVSDAHVAAIGLSDYMVEAQDILRATKLHGYSARRAVSEVLQQAFLIELDNAELDRYGSEIAGILAKS